ncbi:HET-domain-containing protein [Apiospora hydei]|uniref:HET-domain-containing protein n=1 Tax=Apiospora hydei TaxID=1337664 RepID=A0ABR1WQJ6_9PEZI
MAHLYTYKPIDLSKDAIPLLRLFPHYDNVCEIRCEIFEAFVSDEERLPYEALSYTWEDGVTKSSPTVTLSGQKVSVTHNLLDALYHLRRSDRDRILWVDALCINQQDHREKGHQVGQMKDTYEKAEMVLVWLGRSSLEINELMDWMNDIARELRNFNWLSKPLEEYGSMSPLIEVIDWGQTELVKLLLEHGANIEEPYEGKTPLYHALVV